METINLLSKPKRRFTPEQKAALVQKIRSYPTIKEGCQKEQIHKTQYQDWSRQLNLSIRAGLRNHKPSESQEMKQLRLENASLKNALLNLTVEHMAVKKIIL